MASLLIRNVDAALRDQLKTRARRYRRSLDPDVRELLRAAIARDASGGETLPNIGSDRRPPGEARRHARPQRAAPVAGGHRPPRPSGQAPLGDPPAGDQRHELVGIDREHLRFVAEGMTVLIPRAKRDQEGRGPRLAYPAG